MLRKLKRIKVYVFKEGDRGLLRLWYRDPLTGRKVRRSAGTRRMAEAQRAAALLEEEVNATRQNFGGVSWDQFRAKFTDEHLAEKSQSTRDNFRHAFNRFERDCGTPADIREITGIVLSTWKRKLSDSNLSPASVSSNLRCVRVALNWATKIGLLQTAPKIVMPVGSSSRGRPVTLLEFIRLLRAVPAAFPECPDEAVRLVKTLWLSGLRLDEALRLSWPDGASAGCPVVLLDKHRFPAIEWTAASQKSRKADLTPIPPDFAKFLRRIKNRTGLVLNLPLARTTIGKRLSAAGKAAGVSVSDSKHVTAHDLRRTFGNRWALKVHPLVLRAMMRHKSMETTLRYYVDLRLDDVGESLWGGTQTGTQTATRKSGVDFATVKNRVK